MTLENIYSTIEPLDTIFEDLKVWIDEDSKIEEFIETLVDDFIERNEFTWIEDKDDFGGTINTYLSEADQNQVDNFEINITKYIHTFLNSIIW